MYRYSIVLVLISVVAFLMSITTTISAAPTVGGSNVIIQVQRRGDEPDYGYESPTKVRNRVFSSYAKSGEVVFVSSSLPIINSVLNFYFPVLGDLACGWAFLGAS
ncbi:hypothetical protein AMATHDRAFT_51797 [Amanita thiersii Skay4041]|uniref:Uncharacterized protein n=1 Tax=Amanita thiersii Skay4041 TaxID=703135 RepID=A0A2A9NBJ8_9AGAR|nr:hypothetical protein AMATHDRAFT_51797 [Amanita thiersii Skay4041]